MKLRNRQLRKKDAPRGALTPIQWNQLLRRAINRAKRVGDSRTKILESVQTNGQAEKTLRRMSIICDADIAREFPE